jgi:NADH dehydrogenase (ubiquinone) flavoprotein 2
MLSVGIVQHRPADYNRPDMPFEFTAENKQRIEQILKRYPPNYRRSAVIPFLYLVQEQNNNWVPLAAMNKIASLLDMAPIRVYEVASFYTMFNREPVGKYHLQVCGTTPCQLCGAERIIETIEKHLKIKSGETTPDGMFTLSEVECLGACVNAPMLQIGNKEFYENLTPETTVKLLEDLRAGRTPKVGPQNGQRSCEGPKGQTTLKKPDQVKPVCRDLDALKEAERQKAEKTKAEAAVKAAAAASGAAPAGGASPAASGTPASGAPAVGAAPKKP